MYCRSCGKEVANEAIACVGCGVAPGTGNKYCANCGIETPPQAVFCTKCGANTAGASGELKSKLAAGLLGILLGGLGIHRFYLGYTGLGIAQIAVTVVTCGFGALWGFVEGILVLTGNINRDALGRPLKD